MANGYLPTGISSTPINIAGAGQRLMQTAVEQKLADIEQGRAMADESQQAALEAMSMKTIQGLDRKLQDRYSEQFDQHRQKIVDMLSKSGGVLNRQQQMQIRNEQEDIINQTMADNEAMQARNAVREFLLDPNTQYGYSMDAIAQELSNWDKKFEKGEYLGDPRTILMKHQLEAPVTGYIAQRYQPDIESLGKEEWGDFQGNVFSTTEVSGLYARNPEAVDKAIRVRDDIMQDPNVVSRYTNPDGTIDEDKRAEVQQRVEDAISKRISEASKGSTRTTDDGSDTISKSAVELTPTSGGVFNFPVDVTQAVRNVDLVELGAVDADTGEKINDRFMESRLVNMDLDDNTITLKTKGGGVSRNGDQLYGKMSGYGYGTLIRDDLSSKKSLGATKSEIEGKASDIIKANSQYKKGIVKNVKVTETEGGIIITGTAYDTSWGKAKGEGETVTVEYNPLRDESVERFAKVPLPKFRNLLAKYGKKFYITANDGKQYSLGQILDNPSLYGKTVEDNSKSNPLPPSLKIK